MKANLKVRVYEDGSFKHTIDNRVLSLVFGWLYSLSVHNETKQKVAQNQEPRGRIVKVSSPKKYDYEDAHAKRKGGRVVRLMPTQLKKMKAGQEAPRNE